MLTLCFKLGRCLVRLIVDNVCREATRPDVPLHADGILSDVGV